MSSSRCWPYVEQQNIYNSVNFAANIYSSANLTVQATGISTLWCPSDARVSEKVPLPYPVFDIPAGNCNVRYTSYAGSAGVFYVHPSNYNDADVASIPFVTRQSNGVFYVDSSVKLAGLTDGTSNTMLFGERGHSLLAARRFRIGTGGSTATSATLCSRPFTR